MFRVAVETRQRLRRMLLIVAFIVFVQDLSGGGGAQAWTYNYSTTPNRVWLEARQWCLQHFTDLVPIRNREENDFLNNMLPYHRGYYWIGIGKEGRDWVWKETREKVPKEAQNWASKEPDNIAAQDCVEIYIKRDKDTAKWNNESCRKKKGTICYSASCTKDSCSANADCVETIGEFACRCHPGFLGSRCEEAIACTPSLDPKRGSHHCFHPHEANRFNSSCRFHCELGFQLVGLPQRRCQANGRWDHPAPLCRVERCPLLNRTGIGAGRLNCSHPIASYSYNSTCEVRCDEGYEHSGPHQIRCDRNGQWTASVHPCTIKKCSPVFFPITGNVTCVNRDALEPFSFGSRCNFTCQEGYHLTREDTFTCLASGQWSNPTPTCAVVQCSRLKAPPHASMQCQDPLGNYSYGSMCTWQCEQGFDLIGTNVTTCSSQGNWSFALPVCRAKRCDPIDPPHGSLNCSDPNGSFRFGSVCTAACDEGFLPNGTAGSECTSLGRWSADLPHCLARRCPALSSPSHGSLTCSHPHGEFSFGSRCTSACEEGFLLNGTADTECTSLGEWSAHIPHCLVKRCPALSSPSHGSLTCSDPHGEFSFASRCISTCMEGFVLNGTADTECTSLGEWSADIQHCLAKRCLALSSASHGSLSCSDPHGEFSFGSRCTSACEEGFLLNGTADTECTSLGEWSAHIPRCLVKRCPALSSPSHGSLTCSDPHGEFSFASRCISTCMEGFVLNGTADTECTSRGAWSADIQHCLAKRCPALSSPSHGSLTCSDLHGEFSFGSRCMPTCMEGFILNGTADTECTSRGAWSAHIPHCLAERCPAVSAPPHGSLVCSDPHGEFSFGSRCTSACEEGFARNGTADTECTSVGMWSRGIPHCLAQPCPLLAKAPQHGRMNCSHPHASFSFDSHCDFECNEGFWRRGTPTLTCNNSGYWSQDLPTCQPVQCEAIRASSESLSVNCSHPLGNFSFSSQCLFSCEEGFSLNGTEVLLCSSSGFWNDSRPNCTEMPVVTGFLPSVAVAAFYAVPLVFIGLALIIWRLKKRGKTNKSEAPAWGDRENPAFDFET